MEKMKKSALRRGFIKYVLAAFFGAAAVSVIVIVLCGNVRARLVPNSDMVYLNWGERGIESSPEKPNYGFQMIELAEPSDENPFYSENTRENRTFVLSRSRFQNGDAIISVTRIYGSPDTLSNGDQFLYHLCGAAMVVVPILVSLAAVLLCGYLFYAMKLKRPIELLSRATEKISAHDLDFTLDYHTNDELGTLCGMFEQMRAALRKNNEEMWHMLNERRRLQASVAHDLRNPITIIEGYTEYLKINLQNGKADREKLLSVADNITNAAKRLEHYTESIRAINRIEELEVKREDVDFGEVFLEISDDFSSLGGQGKIKITCTNNVIERKLKLDKQALYRIIENLVGNAMRFAKNEINVEFSLEGSRLLVKVSDDGCGFPEKLLKSPELNIPSSAVSEEHLGLGLPICRILARKHSGELVISNGKNTGAVVKIFLLAK